MEVVVGLRVVRGPDWKWGEQDGGEGHLGTVAALEAEGSSVVVQWDCGFRCRYRCGGQEGRFDLRVYDTAPAGIKHTKVQCDWCRKFWQSGLLWKCICCFEYYLCMECYMAERHSLCHEFDRIDSGDLKNSIRVTLRHQQRKVAVKGLFPGAKVMRGRNWRWGDQDGGQGSMGKVIGIKSWQNKTDRSVAEVQWSGVQHTNVYRIGLHGKVDLMCTKSGSAAGGHYYPYHLPVLGAPYIPRTPTEFSAGDTVKVEVDIEVFKLMQENHGGWNEMMLGFLGSTGMLYRILESGDLLVRYPNNAVFVFNPEVVTKVDAPYLMPGDIVRVLDDIGQVHQLQQGEPGWVDDMALCLGMVGRVTKRCASGAAQVSVNGKRWIFNCKCLVPTPDAIMPNNANDEEVDMNSRLQMLAMVSDDDDNPEGITYAAAAGDAATLRRQLDKYPEQIDIKVKGRTALHVSCTDGYIDCLKFLLQRGADMDLMDDSGERALHICAFANQVEAARVLLENGVDVNSRNVQDCTALMVAAGVGHCSIVRLLADHQQVDLHAQDSNGSTALHCAVVAQRSKAVSILLEGGADPSRVNFRCSTPLHDAAGFGLLPAIERMVAHHPELINIQKVEDGYTPLHVAAANNHPTVAEFLSQQSSCNLNLTTSKDNLTPLHVAVHEGYSRMVENLVGSGANLNAITSDGGNTVLHLAISRKNMRPLSPLTPQLKKVESQLLSKHTGFNFEPYVVVACFLVQEGGDLYMKNFQGISPTQLAPSDMGNVIASFIQGRSHGTFHGSLRGRTLAESSSSLPHTSQPQPSRTTARTPPPPVGKSARKPPSTTSQPIPPSPSTPHLMQPPSFQATPASRSPFSSAHSPPSLNQDMASSPDQKKNTNLDKEMPKGVGRKPKLHEQRNDTGKVFKDVPGLGSTPLHVAATKKDEESDDDTSDLEPGSCFMCENPANARLQPCGHTGMCLGCARSAKRCPQCKTLIEVVTNVY